MRLIEKKWFRAILFLIPLAFGVFFLIFSTVNRQGPEETEAAAPSRLVRFIEISPISVLPRAVGFGYAEPEKVWEAVAEVSGKIVEFHPQFKAGAFLPSGSVLLRIDPTEYQLVIAEKRSNIKATEVQLSELDVKEANAKALLEIEERKLALSEDRLSRQKALLDSGAIPQAKYDEEETTVLAQRARTQDLRNTLSLIPYQRESFETQIQLLDAQLKRAELDLSHTTITVPFDCRLSTVDIELGQAVHVGEILATADSVARAEVTAQISIDALKNVVKGIRPEGGHLDLRSFLGANPIDLPATVRLLGGDLPMEWNAKVVRLSDKIDRQTRTIGMVVGIENPYNQVVPGVQPPLIKGMYCEVEIQGATRSNSFVIPRTALHGDQVYLVDANGRLRRQEVVVDFFQSDFCTIREGLKIGDKVVLTDLSPAIEGMPLEVVEDRELQDTLLREATGRSDLR